MNSKSINYSTIIKNARQQRKLTQEKLADKIGVGKTTISNYEIGYSTPSAEIMEKIALALDFNLPDMILSGAGFFDLKLPRTFQGVNDVFVPYIKPEDVSLKNIENKSYMNSYITVPGFMLPSESGYICIKATDNSMEGNGIFRNDYVFVRKSHNLHICEIVLAVNIHTDEYVIRRYHRDNHTISLVPSSQGAQYSIISYDEAYPEYEIVGYVEKVLSNIK